LPQNKNKYQKRPTYQKQTIIINLLLKIMDNEKNYLSEDVAEEIYRQVLDTKKELSALREEFKNSSVEQDSLKKIMEDIYRGRDIGDERSQRFMKESSRRPWLDDVEV
jgi:hypothetical protein